MLWSKTLIPTLKEDPADAQIASHRLLVRAGFVRQLAAGVYSILPLGWRSMRKAMRIIREEMDAIGCAEVHLPALQPLELWQQSGRDVLYGENLMQLTDRHGRGQVLGPTHEEVITTVVRDAVNSYKQLPLYLYQIQTKLRDEFRPRFGLLRVREFFMKDAYSFDLNPEGLDAAYDKFYAAYEKIFDRCGVPYVIVEAESGPIGGSVSHEFMGDCEVGEDVVVTSDKGNYAANLEKARIGERSSSFGGDAREKLEKVHTPGMPGIEKVAEFLKIEPKQMLKTLIFRTSNEGPADESGANPSWLAAVVRGDHDVNEAKLAEAAKEHFDVDRIELVDDEKVRQKWSVGFVSPAFAAKELDTAMLVDPDAAQPGPWVTGADEVDHHVKGFNWFRECGDVLADPRRVVVADIRNALAGDPSPMNDGGRLRMSRGIELGHVFKLGTRYSDSLDATVLDEGGKPRPIVMGCYGIGVGRILIAAVEAFHDDRGIRWPVPLAPYSVLITPIKYDGEVKQVADRLHEQLDAAGIDTLLDDRPERPGVKFADADLIGIPVRLVIGDRGLKEGKIELKRRDAEEAEAIAVDNALPAVRQILGNACASV